MLWDTPPLDTFHVLGEIYRVSQKDFQETLDELVALLEMEDLLQKPGMVLWSPGFLFTWIFDSLFQMARYPVGLYPGWLRLILTWIIPVGIMTTIPAQALTGSLTSSMEFVGAVLSIGFLVGASMLFRTGLQRYASASS